MAPQWALLRPVLLSRLFSWSEDRHCLVYLIDNVRAHTPIHKSLNKDDTQGRERVVEQD